MEFKDLGLKPELLKAVDDLGFTAPSDIQRDAIPLLIKGETDFVGQAQTGTGKTAAFVLPLLERLDGDSKNIQALVLTPTRELANQVCEEVKKLGKYDKVRSLAIFGGASYDRQITGLKKGKPQIVVGTPGRVIDMIKQGYLKLEALDYIILDEADEMLNMGFFEDVQTIIATVEKEKRMWMFSATMPPQILSLIKKEFKNPEVVKVAKKAFCNEDIDQRYYLVNQRYFQEALCRLLDGTKDIYGIVFCRTRVETSELAAELLRKGYRAEALHGDMGQAQRDKAMANFKAKKTKLMICTDVAARGIDVTGLSHVVNYGFPQDYESYVHRIGRTGRAGEKGIAITLLDPRDRYKVKKLEFFTKQKMNLATLPSIEELKSSMVTGELEKMSGVIESVLSKGEEFGLDKTFELFQDRCEVLSKEELMKVIFTWGFNKDLRRFDNMGDLSVTPRKGSKSGTRDGRRDRKRDGRSEGRGEGRRDFSREGRSGGSRRAKSADVGDTRLFLNIGKDDGLRLQHLLNDITKQTGVRKNQIRNVDMKGRFSFIDIPSQYKSKFLKNSQLKIINKKVRFECSEK